MAGIELRGVRKSFGTVEVIGGTDLMIEDGGFTVFVGPSGCGKSTLLRLMSGLDEISGGEILLGGRRCDHLMPAARGMAMVFQSYALYPHMNVEQNLRFGLENARLSKAQIAARVVEAAEILKIEPLLRRRPGQLSGGQSQRVAIGRAIVKEPEVFLFDEPLSNLDAELRIHMRSELVSLYRRLGTTMVYVTHDQTEAMTMATRIVVLRGGAVEQVGAPIELYARPRNAFVAGFLGTPKMNFLPARYEAGARPCARLASGGTVELPDRMRARPDGEPVTLGIRPEHAAPAAEGVAVRVDASEVLGAETILLGEAEGGTPFTLTRRGIVHAEAGQVVPVHLPPEYLHAFDADGLSLARAGEDWQAAYLSEMSPGAGSPLVRAGGVA